MSLHHDPSSDRTRRDAGRGRRTSITAPPHLVSAYMPWEKLNHPCVLHDLGKRQRQRLLDRYLGDQRNPLGPETGT